MSYADERALTVAQNAASYADSASGGDGADHDAPGSPGPPSVAGCAPGGCADHIRHGIATTSDSRQSGTCAHPENTRPVNVVQVASRAE